MWWFNCGLLLLIALIGNPTTAREFVDVCAERAKEGISPTKPSNTWGAYQSVNKTMKDKFFHHLWKRVEPLTECDSTLVIILDRVYFNLNNPNLVLYSFLCEKCWCYQHVKADFSKGDNAFVQFAEKVSQFGILDAKDFANKPELTLDEEMDARVYAKPIFELIKNQINQTVCPDPGLEVVFYVLEKDENELHYWKFPVSCGKNAEEFIVIHVVQDQKNCYVKDGKVTLVTFPDLAATSYQYHHRESPLEPTDVTTEFILQTNVTTEFILQTNVTTEFILQTNVTTEFIFQTNVTNECPHCSFAQLPSLNIVLMLFVVCMFCR